MFNGHAQGIKEEKTDSIINLSRQALRKDLTTEGSWHIHFTPQVLRSTLTGMSRNIDFFGLNKFAPWWIVSIDGFRPGFGAYLSVRHEFEVSDKAGNRWFVDIGAGYNYSQSYYRLGYNLGGKPVSLTNPSDSRRCTDQNLNFPIMVGKNFEAKNFTTYFSVGIENFILPTSIKLLCSTLA